MRPALNDFVLNNYFPELFDFVMDILFFVKDCDSTIISGNQLLADHLGLKSSHELAGKSDFDLYPTDLAVKYREDDLEVIQSEKPKFNIIEIFPDYLGEYAWFKANKIPLKNKEGRVIGLCGILQSFDEMNHTKGAQSNISDSLAHLHQNYTKNLSNDELAKLSHMTVRNFEVHFKNIFNTSPRRYLLKLRIQKACKMLLKSDDSLSQLATFLGFCDQSAFTASFKKQTGLTPLKYREKYKH